MYKKYYINNLIKHAAKKDLPLFPPVHPLVIMRAQNMGINPNFLLREPGKATDQLFSQLINKRVPELQYKTAEIKEPIDLSNLSINSKLGLGRQLHNRNNHFSALHGIAATFARNHAIVNPDILDGEGKNVLSMNTRQDISNPNNIGSYGRGSNLSINHRYFGT